MVHWLVWRKLTSLSAKQWRNTVLFTFGILVAYHELFLLATPRTEALLFSAALMGLPFTLGQDEKGK
jgi:hypothetical protein